MTTIQDMVWRNKGEAICSHLKGLGLKPVWLEVAADRIAIGFEFLSDAPTWTRAFYVDGPKATPEAFVREINAWKNEVRRAVVQGKPSSVVKGAIEYHGMGAVLDAMEDTPMEPVH